MKLFHKKLHSNGFKIIIASQYTNCSEKIVISQQSEVRKGAYLEILVDDIPIELDANSAVVYLLSQSRYDAKCIQKWLDFEVDFQSLLEVFLRCPASGKESNVVKDDLLKHLSLLEEFLQCSNNQYISGSLTAADIVLYGALYDLNADEKFSKLLQTFTKIQRYLSGLRELKEFRDAEEQYFKGSRPVVAINQATPEYFTSKNCTWSLLQKDSTCAKTTLPATEKSKDNAPAASKEESPAVSAEEIKKAEEEWMKDVSNTQNNWEKVPPLPIKGENNIMITSALPYVNNVPHLGNIIGCVLSADCFARFCRLRGDNVMYICGTDEYGTATETKAVAEGVTPQQICDKYHKIHSDVYDWFNIAFDHFGRTTTNSQTELAQSIFWDLEKNKKITKNIVEQLYCNKCNIFLADRFVEGVCPQFGCGFEDARGDQCDGCGKLVNAIDLIKPRCKFCSQTPIVRQSQHLFLDLPQLESELSEWFKYSSQLWSANARVICESWLRDGLKERCITRDLKWGTPVPMEGFKNKVFYVWYDAPIGYISITKEYTKDWAKWWMDPENVKYYQFMAKDNVPFHGVIFPSTLLGTNKVWTKVTHLMATEYLNYEDGKFSKSRSVGVFGDHAKDTGIVSDVWRFYLLYLRPEAQDTSFSWIDLQTKNNTELLNNVGNFVNRSLKFVYQFYGGQLPDVEPNNSDFTMMASVNLEVDKYWNCLSNCKIRDGIRAILAITKLGNQYIQENEPYKLIKPDRSDEDKRRGATVINISANIVGLVGVLLEPYMPDMSKTILDILGNLPSLLVLPKSLSSFIKPGHKIKEPYPLVRKITDDEIKVLRERFAGSGNVEKVETKTLKSGQNITPVVSQAGPLASPEELECLDKKITEQGTKVRELKENKASKEDITKEVSILLDLKKQLMIAQGIDPAAEAKKSGKKKKK